MFWLQVALLLGLPLWFQACATISGRVPEPAERVPSGRFEAGAAKVDITPLPGSGTNGHSIAGAIARGYWTRLYARAIYFEDARGRSVAFVSCDLGLLPANLKDRVAEIISTKKGCQHLGGEQLLIAATHTHHGPGNYMSTAFYNLFAGKRMGFDPDLFEFLSQRIACSVTEAIGRRKPVRLILSKGRVKGLCRNRSINAFLNNPEAQEVLARNEGLPMEVDKTGMYPNPMSYRAVNPEVAVLRAESLEYPRRLVAVAAFVSVHNTAMEHSVPLYQSDVLGVAATQVEQTLTSTYASPVVALFNGAEADISPAWHERDAQDTERLGLILGCTITHLVKEGCPLPPEIDYRTTAIRMPHANFIDSTTHQRAATPNPLVGRATVCGAEDGRTFFEQIGWREGQRGFSGPHTPKLGAFDPAILGLPLLPFSPTAMLMRLVPPPHIAPLSIFFVGRVPVAATPFETSVVMGSRISREIAQVLGCRPGEVLLIGLANEYFHYLTTREEYMNQDYEGASTHWGPDSGPVIQNAFKHLATRFNEPRPAQIARMFQYYPGFIARGKLEREGNSDPFLARQLRPFFGSWDLRDYPRFDWIDCLPSLKAELPATPQVAIERKGPNGHWGTLVTEGRPETDAGTHFLTIGARKSSAHQSKWWALWLAPKFGTEIEFRWRVKRLDGGTIYSPGFHLPRRRPHLALTN